MDREPTSNLAGPSPYDSAASSSLRFLLEIVAWVAGPWAVADLTGQAWTAIPAVVALLALPSVFSTPGDKNQVIVGTPGPVRIVIELALIAAAVAGAWIVWPVWLAAVVSVVAVAGIITGLPRLRWLAAGAPPVS
ncbi:MAG: hypothetical protein QNJ88_12225 [Acidimicrobiia bacterium]|nr:hypothetical protein [Acidimicrobiia bacterium]